MTARKINDKTIRSKTGRSSKEWNKILDSFKNPNHTLMAKYLCEKYDVNPWWAQTLTNRYEWERGLREK